jgi:hypothetical protein
MRVNPNADVPGPIGPERNREMTPPAAPRDSVDLAHSTALSGALRIGLPADADRVAKAKALLEDPGYPSDATLARVAGVLAANLQPPPVSN